MRRSESGRVTGGASSGEGAEAPLRGPAATLKEAGARSGRLIGAALAASHLGESDYVTAAREHDFVTPENEMKWETIEPTRGNYDFEPGDRIVRFARQNGMQVKGHTLVWHSQLPQWVAQLSSERDVRAAMLDHIGGVVTHFRGQVTAWDVVNEAWETTSKTGDGNPVLRDSVFMRYLGAGYIEEAFLTARAADPGAQLYYNDFSAEGMNDKSDAVYAMLRGMVERGVPIDGVGLQMHIGAPNDSPPISEIAENMQRIAELGLKLMVSEMDVHCCAGESPEQQRARYHEIVAACVAQPACVAVTFWGITDRYSWINDFTEAHCGPATPSPLLWDEDYRKKPAYTGVMEALTLR